MTLAVVVATEPIDLGAAAGLAYDADRSLLGRLLDQLASLNVPEIHVIARRDMVPVLRTLSPGPGTGNDAQEPCLKVIESDDLAQDLREISRLARAATEPMLVLHGDVVASDELLSRLERGAKGPAAAVTGPFTDTRPPIRVSRHLIDSAGSRHHQVTNPDGVFRGVLRIAPPATGVLADAAEELATLVETPGALGRPDPVHRTSGEIAEHLEVFVDNDVDGDLAAGKGGVSGPPATTAPTGDDVPALLLVGLVRSGVRVTARGAGGLVCDRVLTAEEAAAARTAVEAVDEEKLRLDAAVKSNDGFFTTYAVSSYSRYIARWAAKRRLTPNMVTSFSMWIAVVAAVWFAAGTRLGMVVGAVLFYFSFVFDCVDGQLARYTRQYSTLGAWLDATFDRAKEYVVYAGLAVGSTVAAAGSGVSGGDVWGLAVATLILQTLRHMVDFSFAAGRTRATPEPRPTRALAEPGDGAQPVSEPAAAPVARPAGRGAGAGRLVVRLSHRTEKIPGLRWAKKIVVLPIGERFALISITAALFNAQVTFIALLVWGSLAAAYTLTGRVLRSLAK
ncbi:CDP-alcohol phosphatidyltransferase family protein [Actinomadura scrupuli]|uniref:CDP-alcohol phosphatidyltransferase family protein n=1 Tax=Actinomadura scrupuli TaxID=559629 RepID=UPI003D97872E